MSGTRTDESAEAPIDNESTPSGLEPDEPTAETVETVGLELVEEDPLVLAQADLEAERARLRTVSKAYKDLQEEFAAFRVRLERQQAMKEEILKGDVVSKLFEPLENLKRSLEALQGAGVDPNLLQGVELVHKAFRDGFESMGLAELGVEGELFDTNVHEALTMMPVTDANLDGRVVQVFDHGYRVGSRTIRPARVIVGQYTPPETTGEA